MPEESKLELKNLLKIKLNEDTVIFDKDRFNNESKIIKRGRINNNIEYSLLLSRVEEIYADESKAEEVKKFNELLADYHRSTDIKLQ